MKVHRHRPQSSDPVAADPRVLGQILAAQNVEFALPDTRHIAEFFSGTLQIIPGASGNCVCLDEAVACSPGMARDFCRECQAERQANASTGRAVFDDDFVCQLRTRPGMQATRVNSLYHDFGYFVVRVADPAVFATYEPFIHNLANYVAISLENRLQRSLLEKASAEAHQRVEERTQDLLRLAELNRDLEEFAYSVSHDLRAPLRHVHGFLALLRKRASSLELDEQSRRYMTVISASVDRMSRLIDDLLAFSRMGRKELVRRSVDLNELVREVVEELKPETENRDIRWHVQQLPEVTGDRPMLRAVLTNLVSNALKFTRPRGLAEIEIGSRPGEGEVVFFIRDNGVGFDMRYAHKLFGVFQRLHHADQFEGTGIGLANIQRIVSRHGGRTWAEGEPDRGATFYFALPAAEKAE